MLYRRPPDWQGDHKLDMKEAEIRKLIHNFTAICPFPLISSPSLAVTKISIHLCSEFSSAECISESCCLQIFNWTNLINGCVNLHQVKKEFRWSGSGSDHLTTARGVLLELNILLENGCIKETTVHKRLLVAKTNDMYPFTGCETQSNFES